MTRSTASAPVASTLARVVSKWVLFGHDLAGPAEHAEQDPLGGPPLVGRDHVLEREQLLHRVAEDEPRRRPGVGLVAVLDRRPLVAAHRAGAGVGEQVDEDVLRPQLEQVEAGLARAARRCSSVVSRSGSTEWIRNGSMIVRGCNGRLMRHRGRLCLGGGPVSVLEPWEERRHPWSACSRGELPPRRDVLHPLVAERAKSRPQPRAAPTADAAVVGITGA